MRFLANTSLFNNLENVFLIAATAVRLRLSRSPTLMRRPPFKPWVVSIPSCLSRRDAPNATTSSTTGTVRSPYAALNTATGRVHGKTATRRPTASSSPPCKRFYPCTRLSNRLTSSSTTSARTKLRRSASSSNKIPESGFTSRPLNRPDSTRSNSGSPRSNATSPRAASVFGLGSQAPQLHQRLLRPCSTDPVKIL